MATARCRHCNLPLTEREANAQACPACGGVLRDGAMQSISSIRAEPAGRISNPSARTPDGLEIRPTEAAVVLYDGHCRFCKASVDRLVALARPGTLKPVSFQDPGVLARYPGLTHDMCMKQMYLITPAGRRYGGFEAAVQAVATRPVLGWFARIYYVPIIRQLLDLIYGLIAAHRYRIMGKAVAAGACDGGTCSLHTRHALARSNS
jgi:predicted DCC family thiol-disulfide oxidoreductase YuxK